MTVENAHPGNCGIAGGVRSLNCAAQERPQERPQDRSPKPPGGVSPDAHCNPGWQPNSKIPSGIRSQNCTDPGAASCSEPMGAPEALLMVVRGGRSRRSC
eukprot:8811517-Alexandrium_andersonii.AAC.1